MKNITKTLLNEQPFARAMAALEAGACPVLLSGLAGVHRAQAAAALYLETGRPIFAVCPDEGEAERFAADMAAFTGVQAEKLFGRDFVFYNADGVSRPGEHSRISALNALLRRSAPVTVATVEGVMLRTMPPGLLEELSFTLSASGSYELEELTGRLVTAGYERTAQVEGVGQFALRGGILDIYSPAHDAPVRCEFFGDDVDSMGLFDPQSQRRTTPLEEALILPAGETPPDAALGGREGLAKRMESLLKNRIMRRRNAKKELIDSISGDIDRLRDGRALSAADRYIDLMFEPSTAVDYIDEDAVIVLIEPARLSERAKNFVWQLNEDVEALARSGVMDAGADRFFTDWTQTVKNMGQWPVFMLANFTTSAAEISPKTIEAILCKQLPSYGGSLETAAEDISHYLKEEYAVVVLAEDVRRAQTLGRYLIEKGFACAYDFEMARTPEKKACTVGVAALSAGFEYPGQKLAVITEGQLTARPFRKKARRRKAAAGEKLMSYTDLTVGDLVVHESYGIGRFAGIVRRRYDNVEKDYIKIVYSGTDALFVPATQLDMVTKYIGGAEEQVKLSKLGGTDWTKAKLRAKGAVKELADGLIKLQAERMQAKGFAFSPDSPWQTEFEDAFEYQETDDQLRSIQEIKRDMERPMPMDRLLCGDVGYGKTEVALRAVMKCIMDGKQAAILVPTTVLAQQHLTTATRRFAGYPVNIDMLSRFRTPTQIRRTLKGLESGSVDLIVGTHKLLGKDVHFHDLGLLVVDEEQRFGVQHKERLKEMSHQVDVLTLSATPIPRTLNMALSGVRDMSTIEEPPQDRQPVQTYVLEHDWAVIADAIRREVSRGGQVYYLHNRVDTITRTAARLAQMLPDVSFGIGHGKMDEDELGRVMEQMAAGELQVLVCTTIIETGIDIPNVNTLIIEDADRLGLAQLHQIRGRVGRSSRRAFAYFTFRQGKVLTEVAEKRLAAIREFAQFNSGFKIAMRDLEIRGAGNLLGAEQSGHMMSVGYDMYLKLLEEAVHEEKGESVPKKPECSADLAVSANIPESYVSSAEQRMDLYRRIAAIRTEADADDMTDELIDRFGDPPSQVNALIHIALLRGEAADTGITDISQKEGRLYFKIGDFRMDRISMLYAMPEYKARVRIEAGSSPCVSLRLEPGARVLESAVRFVRDYKTT